MKRLAFLLAILLGAVAVVFAVSNLQRVTLSLWPLPFELEAPLFLIGLAGIVVGILAGGAIAWVGQRVWRRRARQLERRIARLEKDLSALQKERDQARQEAKRARQAEAVEAEPVPAGAKGNQRLLSRSAS